MIKHFKGNHWTKRLKDMGVRHDLEQRLNAIHFHQRNLREGKNVITFRFNGEAIEERHFSSLNETLMKRGYELGYCDDASCPTGVSVPDYHVLEIDAALVARLVESGVFESQIVPFIFGAIASSKFSERFNIYCLPLRLEIMIKSGYVLSFTFDKKTKRTAIEKVIKKLPELVNTMP